MSSENKPPFWDEYLEAAGETGGQIEQEDVEALIRISRESQNPGVALEYAQRAANASPEHPLVQESVQRTVFNRLDQDAFLAFVAESTQHYVIRFRSSRPIVVPKARTHQDPFPAVKRTEGEHVLGMIWWVILGLVPAGVGALAISPLVAYRALYILTGSASEPREKRMAWITVLLAALFGFVGGCFTFLLILHLIG